MTGAIEVRGIHHRASHSFRTTNKKGKKVICARHSPGVGHAQDLTRIPKWKLGRVLSCYRDITADISPFGLKPRQDLPLGLPRLVGPRPCLDYWLRPGGRLGSRRQPFAWFWVLAGLALMEV
ncbi:UDP-glucosyl transferase 73B3 [Prunus dulcis]|uniref:UDP-glucosyl transferase 73B3 n=1 Tax=Prunus dulcis TaxID=3755 RepID=A0A4Y1RXW0_PRUDU|nr:UDP-glucosyl transferase 73B3 [Prunus dulcis]